MDKKKEDTQKFEELEEVICNLNTRHQVETILMPNSLKLHAII